MHGKMCLLSITVLGTPTPYSTVTSCHSLQGETYYYLATMLSDGLIAFESLTIVFSLDATVMAVAR